MNLDVNTWKPFAFGDLINEIYKAKAHAKIDLVVSDVLKDGYVPFVSRTENDNGVDCYVLESDLQYIETGNAIVIGDTTSTISYQAQSFATGDHMIIIRAEWLNYYTALFIVSLLQKERFRYSYGRAFLIELIKSTIIWLPVGRDHKPDWHWVEKYIKLLRYKKVTTKNKVKTDTVNVFGWKAYRLDYLFDFKKGKRLVKEDMEAGDTNYLGAISINNGIRQKIKCKQEDQYAANCITVNYNGSVGEAFYQHEPFWPSDDVNVLYAKAWWELNPHIAMFIITVIRTNKYKFDYGRKWTLEKMKESTILLPATCQGEPDWEWIEHYIKSLPYSDKMLHADMRYLP